jgi:hypothetical protein
MAPNLLENSVKCKTALCLKIHGFPVNRNPSDARLVEKAPTGKEANPAGTPAQRDG